MTQLIENAKAHRDRIVGAAQTQKHAAIADANARRDKATSDARAEQQQRVQAAEQAAAERRAPADTRMADAQAAQRQLNDRKGQYEQQLGSHFDTALQHHNQVKVVAASAPRRPLHVINAVPAGTFQQVWQGAVDRGYRPIFINGNEVGGRTYFDVIFQKSTGVAWVSFHGLNGTQYQEQFNKLVAERFRLAHINSYVSGGQIYYAPIFVREEWPAWIAHHGLRLDAHQNRFNELVQQGYRLVNQSMVFHNGNVEMTVLYDKRNVGGWVALALLDSTQYQQEFDNNLKQGRSLAYLDVINVGGQPRFSAIWNSTKYDGWVARHNMDATFFHNEFMNWVGRGWQTKLVCGYEHGGQFNYAAMWHT